MTTTNLPIDVREREQALDISRSFIVQAPAGSGKTGVLTQRILKLLTVVERPEQILAITFTKKAAAEMRHRVMSSLQNAAAGIVPDNEHDAIYHQLSQQVLQRDRQRQWNLLDNPGRLRLQTIDSLCSAIVRDNPLTARLGVQFNVLDDASDCYNEAARSLLASLDEDDALGKALYRVLGFLDNQYRKLNELISQMLAQRDHWLGDITASQRDWESFRQLMQSSLAHINRESEQRLREAAGPQLCAELEALTVYAGNQLSLAGKDSSLLQVEPDSVAFRKQQWRLFLTKDSEFRKRLDVNCGFPGDGNFTNKSEKEIAKAFNQRAKAFLQSLATRETEILPAILDFIDAPAAELTDQEWQLLSDLVLVLYYAAAHLKIVFQQRKTVDFSEIALAALDTLGDPDQPGETALALDERIQHILVDEFQDTSFIQVNLLEKLTAGWMESDGRTLFLVGDPMQSIYAFRKADVGLFLRLWMQRQLGHVPLATLQLRMNFRSSPAVLDWVNTRFQQAFPERSDARLGAVDFAHSHAGKSQHSADQTSAHLFIAHDDPVAAAQAEASWIADKVLELGTNQNGEKIPSIAVLIRGKSHIAWIVQAFRQRNIAYQAVDIEKLTENQIIQDLLSVYRAYLSPGDKVAWFALLRGPWCGLTLKELQQVAAVDAHPWRALEKIALHTADDGAAATQQQNAHEPPLASAAQQRIHQLYRLFQTAYQQRYQQPFAEALRALVLQLGIPATARSSEEVEAIELFFAMLTRVDETASTPSPDAVAAQLEKLFVPAAAPEAGRAVVQIMTMHKSKGLEFDVVFLPQLQRPGQNDEKPLILVDKQTVVLEKEQELFMAPRPNTETERPDSVFSFLWKQKQQRTRNEFVRLLYVACTRARKQLYLTGCLNEDDKQQIRKPRTGTLLAVIWPALENSAEQHRVESIPAAAVQRPLRQLPLTALINSELSSTVACRTGSGTLQASAPQSNRLSLNTAPENESAATPDNHFRRHAGILVHKLFENWVRYPALINTHISDPQRARWRNQLQNMGVEVAELEQGVQLIERAVSSVAQNPERLHWLFVQPHAKSAAELSLSVQIDNQPHQIILDRTFVQDGVRYIIDYKLSEPAADMASFVAAETDKYRPQLHAYRQALATQETCPARLFLYFPLLDHLHEIED